MTEQQQKSLTSSNNKFFVLLTSLFVTLFVWAWHAKVDITSVANGLVIPEKNITTLGTMVTGKIVKVNFKQGDIVKKGDVIITINPGVGYEPYHIKANIDGKIQELTFKNPGSVVKQGDALAVLVPLDQKLIVQGQLQVKDRGYVELGQMAKIKLASSEAFTYLPITGKIVSISPVLYGTLKPEPKSINSKSLKFLAVSNKISLAYKKTSISKMSLPVCMCIPFIFIFVFSTIRSKSGI